MKTSRNRKFYIRSAVAGVLAALLMMAGLFTTYAYFSTLGKVYTSDNESHYAVFGTDLDLLFDRLSVADGRDIGSGTFDKNAAWGSANNPYIISQTRHLQNLSVLQNIGYFDELFIDHDKIPYFLVCTPEGTPTVIYGPDKAIQPIGNDTYPFVGFVGGAFAEGTCQIQGKSSDTSVLYDITVEITEDAPDVGLFGTIGYLDDPATGEVIDKYSTIENLLLYDVKIRVEQPTIISKTADFVNHLFTFKEAREVSEDVDDSLLVHENHHIGILAGHAEYATISLISVYYSNDDIAAFSVEHPASADPDKYAVPNYMSSTGIVGYLYHMNPEIIETGAVIGTGLCGSEISLNDTGTGSGGGSLSGLGRGYVTAAGIYELFNRTGLDGNGDLILRNATDENGRSLCTEWVRNRLFWGTERTGRYYFHDGVFTFALSSTGSQDKIEKTFNMANGQVTDTFTIGSTAAEAWKKNTAKGNYAVTAYVKPVRTEEELAEANQAGKRLVISHDFIEEGNDKAYLMNLSQANSSANNDFTSNDKYTIAGSKIAYATDDLEESILQSYNADPDILRRDLSDYAIGQIDATRDEAGNATGFGELKVMNLGTSDDDDILNTLSTRYRIGIDYYPNNNYYYHFDNGAPIYRNTAGDIYEAQALDHYYHYTKQTSTVLFWTNYTLTYYYDDVQQATNSGTGNTAANWIPDGWSIGNSDNGLYRVVGEREGIETTPILYLNNSDGTMRYKENGSDLVQMDDEGRYIVPLGSPVRDYLYYDEKIDAYSVIENGASVGSLDNVEIIEVTEEVTGENDEIETIVVDRIYRGTCNDEVREYTSAQVVIGMPLDYYTFSYNDPENGSVVNQLRILYNENRSWFGTNSRYYSIWNGGSTFPKSASGATVKANERAEVKFNGDGSCNIKYSFGTSKRYISYYTRGTTTYFNGIADGSSANARLYIYTIEGISNLNYGHVTFDPREGAVAAENADASSPAIEFPSDQYVLWPNEIVAGAATVENPTYTVKSLNELATAGGGQGKNGWCNEMGQSLSSSDLYKKFHLSSETSWDVDWNAVISFGDRSIATPGFIRAPIGSRGDEANIPQGTVGFKINRDGESRIRVIVALPQSDISYAENEEAYNLNNSHCYFGVWQVQGAGEQVVQTFNRNSALYKFYVPRSEPYSPEVVAAQETYDLTTGPSNNRVTNTYRTSYTVNYDGRTYRTYLNGDKILAAYEFVVDREGVYILGTTGAPMEIVYFSADGTASAGRDGDGGSAIGTIDFVYDYNNNIVTVKEADGNSDVTENYNNYYASLCLLHTENGMIGSGQDAYFPNVNEFEVKIRRFVNNGSQFNFDVTGQRDSLNMIRYATLSDRINDFRR